MNTPTKTRGVGAGKAADLTYWEGAARVIASVSTSSKIIVEKSTVPVKTADAIEKVRLACLAACMSVAAAAWEPANQQCARPGRCLATRAGLGVSSAQRAQRNS